MSLQVFSCRIKIKQIIFFSNSLYLKSELSFVISKIEKKKIQNTKSNFYCILHKTNFNKRKDISFIHTLNGEISSSEESDTLMSSRLSYIR